MAKTTKRKVKRAPVTMLPPENEITVAKEGTIDESVNQARLREFFKIEEEYQALRQKYFHAYARIQDLILHGAKIQQGVYKVQYGVRLIRRPRYKQVVIDLKGEQYQRKVLESTPPHAHFRVLVN